MELRSCCLMSTIGMEVISLELEISGQEVAPYIQGRGRHKRVWTKIGCMASKSIST